MSDIDIKVYEEMGKRYTQHLAQAMGATKDGLMWQLLAEIREKRLVMRMPRRGRYQIWQGKKLKADRIKHRKEALAMLKMFKNAED
jgi:hypothetical protein